MAATRAVVKDDGGPDVERYVRHIRATIHGYDIAEADVVTLMRDPNYYVFVDASEDTILVALVSPDREEVRVVAWLWDGVGDFMARMWPLMVECVIAIVADYPLQVSRRWWVQGNIPGAGDTNADKETSAQSIAERVRDGVTMPEAHVDIVDSEHDGYKVIRGRLGDVYGAAIRGRSS